MVQMLISQWLHEIRRCNYTAILSAGVMLALLMFGAKSGYDWYVVSREQKAQFALAEAFEEYDRAMYQLVEGKENDQVVSQKLEDAHLSFDTVLRMHSSSFLAPCAQSFDADIFWYEGKKSEALAAMEKAIAGVSASSPLYYLLKTKVALMRLDADQEAQGLEELRALAVDRKNSNSDTAAFYLFYFYWSCKDKEKALEAWKLLEYWKPCSHATKRSVSPWLLIGSMKLEQIS